MAVSNEEMIQWLRDFANIFIEGTESYVNLLEAADRIEEMDERIAIMEEGRLDDYADKKHSGLTEE